MKSSSVVGLWFKATVNTWKCKHNKVNNHLHSWFCEFSLRKIYDVSHLTEHTNVQLFRWIVFLEFLGKPTFGTPGILTEFMISITSPLRRSTQYTCWNCFKKEKYLCTDLSSTVRNHPTFLLIKLCTQTGFSLIHFLWGWIYGLKYESVQVFYPTNFHNFFMKDIGAQTCHRPL